MCDGPLKCESRIKNTADQDPDKQGAVHFLCDQRQHNGHEGRKQGPRRGKQLRDILFSLLSRKSQERTAGHEEHDQGERPQNLSLYISHKYLPLSYKDFSRGPKGLPRKKKYHE